MTRYQFVCDEVSLLINKIRGEGLRYNYNPYAKKHLFFDYFEYGGNLYKEKFVCHFKGEKHKDDYDFIDYNLEKFKTKIGGIFNDRNSFNLFFIMYRNTNSLNKYGIKRYLFKKYIESNELSIEKLTKLKDIIIEFYSNEEDINKYILGNKNFIYKNYSDEELDVLYEMGLFIKDDNLDGEIFKNFKLLKLIDVVLVGNNNDNIFKGDIFANDRVYNYFLYFYNNSKSFKKMYTRKNLVKIFLEKDKVGFKTAINYLELLLEYVKGLDEIFSTPYCDLLDDLVRLDELCIKDELELYDNEEAFLEHDRNEEFNKESEKIYSNFELDILSIFFNVDNIQGYTYYNSDLFFDSKYLDNKNKKRRKGIGISSLDYTNLYK